MTGKEKDQGTLVGVVKRGLEKKDCVAGGEGRRQLRDAIGVHRGVGKRLTDPDIERRSIERVALAWRQKM